MKITIVESIDAVAAADWNRLLDTSQPFLRHEFLTALESSAAIGPGTAWLPRYLLAHEPDGTLSGALPLYRKSDSWGEFVFDWAWADAYRRSGLRYYPKLVAAVPFTPATGPRLLVRPGAQRDRILPALLDGALEYARATQASSLHVLFPDEAQALELRERGLLLRKDCQFHWHNRGYASFEEFLAGFTAEKRKKTRRERRRVTEAGISFRTLSGAEMNDDLWASVLPLYASTFWRRGHDPYLGEAFFRAICRTLPAQLVVIVAMAHTEAVAAAICFRSDDTLYGRYWGSAGNYHSLHFETCYYQGIEYCIANGLRLFEPGTQGEHKIARGFIPAEVWSAHWLADPRFAAAIDRHLAGERRHIDDYMGVVHEHTPYRREAP
ncbi:MAG: GNAT family N-acetyltransferase [Gammaproteobacteria bacterium]|nr:MAG: GNAT family N-acetyltransferase [Gammaproteobacteria bacterium]